MVATHLLFFSIDVNECVYEELNACSGRELCFNTEGSYQCVRHPEAPTSSPQKLDRPCEGKMSQDLAFGLDGPWATETLSSCKDEQLAHGQRAVPGSVDCSGSHTWLVSPSSFN